MTLTGHPQPAVDGETAMAFYELARAERMEAADTRIRVAHALCLLGNAMHALKHGSVLQAERFVLATVDELRGK